MHHTVFSSTGVCTHIHTPTHTHIHTHIHTDTHIHTYTHAGQYLYNTSAAVLTDMSIRLHKACRVFVYSPPVSCRIHTCTPSTVCHFLNIHIWKCKVKPPFLALHTEQGKTAGT